MDTLERVKKFNLEWVANGHVYGNNRHNVSCTISVKDDEWEVCGQWLWDNQEHYTGISVLPYHGGTYKQAPFEDCSQESFEKLFTLLKEIDLTKVKEEDDNTEAKDNLACQSGACEIN